MTIAKDENALAVVSGWVCLNDDSIAKAAKTISGEQTPGMFAEQD
jgi:hypothetical protein